MYLTFQGFSQFRDCNSWEILLLFAASLNDYEITEDYRKVLIRMPVNVNCIQWEGDISDGDQNTINALHKTMTYTS